MLPSVVITRPMVECSVITFFVPISAAILNGIGSSYHGVITMRGLSSSMYPRALGTIYPTQSIRRTEKVALLSICTVTAFSGMNFGSVVIMVRPAADCGISSTARSREYCESMLGTTIVSIKRFMKVDLPVLTGPTTPI